MNKTFAGVGKSQFAAVMNRVLQVIRIKQEVRYSELLKQFYYDADDKSMGMIIATLERANLIKLDRTRIEGHRDFYCVYRGREDVEVSKPD
jgi:hypothetical protein